MNHHVENRIARNEKYRRETLLGKWLYALRSGKYEQGKRALKGNNKYCCLGVLCNVYDAGILNRISVYDFLPKSISDLLNLSKSSQCILIECNDEYEMSFEQIADYIESEKELLFEDEDN